MNKLKQTLSWVFGILIGIFILTRVWIEIVKTKVPDLKGLDLSLPLPWEWLLGGIAVLVLLIILSRFNILGGTTSFIGRFLGWLLKWTLILGIIGAILFGIFSDTGKELVEKALTKGEGVMKGATLYEFYPESLGDTIIRVPGLEDGVYSVTFSKKGDGSYFFRCPGEGTGKGNFFRRSSEESLSPDFGLLEIRGINTPKKEAAEHGETLLSEKGEFICSFNFPWTEERKGSCKPMTSISIFFERLR